MASSVAEGAHAGREEGVTGVERATDVQIVRPRFSLLLAVATLLGALGALVALIPTIANSDTSPTVEAVNEVSGFYNEQHHHWAPASVTVAPGGAVTLQNTTEVAHGVEWVGGPATPVCASGVPVGSAPTAAGKKWSGACTFSLTGTYTFYCTVHGAEMTGTITVNAEGTTTTSQQTGSAPTASGESGPATASPLGGSPLSGRASTAVKLARSQHGRSVHGSVNVSSAGVGGRLEVDLLASAASLGNARHGSQTRIGRFLRSSLKAGAEPFTAPLTATGRAALSRRRRLAVTVKIVLTPAHGSAVRVSRSVVLHA